MRASDRTAANSVRVTSCSPVLEKNKGLQETLSAVVLKVESMGLGGGVVVELVFQSAIVRFGRFEFQSPLGRTTLPTTGGLR